MLFRCFGASQKYAYPAAGQKEQIQNTGVLHFVQDDDFIRKGTGYSILDRAVQLVDRFHAAGHEIHEEIVAEGLWGGEVGFAAAHGADRLDELHEGEVVGEHEGVDHDVGSLAAADFLEGFFDDEGVEAEGVFVDAAVGEGERRGFAVGDHDDLLHVFVLFGEDALGEAEAFAGVGVVGADLDAGEL